MRIALGGGREGGGRVAESGELAVVGGAGDKCARARAHMCVCALARACD